NRPLRAIIALVLAVAAAVADHVAGIPLRPASQAAKNTFVTVDVGHLITICATIAFLVFATISTFAFASWARDVLERFIGTAYVAIVRYVTILIGLSVVILVALSMLGFGVAQLVVGGAVTGVLITIAAQQSLSNLFAGVMLQFAQPFRVGDQVRIRSGALAGTIEGTVVDLSITYVRLDTDDGTILLPNSQVLAAAVSPVHSTDSDAAAVVRADLP
ncbi:MAG TPA: mechanosensitive ion channel domain-containing protein, partial [Streptosporangiaceae bacterium]